MFSEGCVTSASKRSLGKSTITFFCAARLPFFGIASRTISSRIGFVASLITPIHRRASRVRAQDRGGFVNRFGLLERLLSSLDAAP